MQSRLIHTKVRHAGQVATAIFVTSEGSKAQLPDDGKQFVFIH